MVSGLDRMTSINQQVNFIAQGWGMHSLGMWFIIGWLVLVPVTCVLIAFLSYRKGEYDEFEELDDFIYHDIPQGKREAYSYISEVHVHGLTGPD